MNHHYSRIRYQKNCDIEQKEVVHGRASGDKGQRIKLKDIYCCWCYDNLTIRYRIRYYLEWNSATKPISLAMRSPTFTRMKTSLPIWTSPIAINNLLSAYPNRRTTELTLKAMFSALVLLLLNQSTISISKTISANTWEEYSSVGC